MGSVPVTMVDPNSPLAELGNAMYGGYGGDYSAGGGLGLMAGGGDPGSYYFDPSALATIPDTLGNGTGFGVDGGSVSGMDTSGNLIYSDSAGNQYTIDPTTGDTVYLTDNSTFSVTGTASDPSAGSSATLPAPPVVPTPGQGVTDITTLTGGVVPSLPDVPLPPTPALPTPPAVNPLAGFSSAIQGAGRALAGLFSGNGSGFSFGGPKAPVTPARPVVAGVATGGSSSSLVLVAVLGAMVYLVTKKR